MDALTVEQFKKALPDKARKNVNPALLAQINKSLSDPDMYDTYRENLLSYTNVMADGRFKLSGYIDAVKYVSHRLTGKTSIAAYSITFPEKIQRWAANSMSAKDISSHVAAFNKSKLVTLITEQSLIPSWILNQDLYQQALNTQTELMLTAKSEKVRTDAANSILSHLKMPETHKIELDIGIKKDSSIDALRMATMSLVEEQRKAIASGSMNAQEIAHSKVVIGERIDD